MTNKRDKASVVGDIAKTICEYVDAKGGNIRIIGTCVPEMLYYSHNAGIGEALYEKGYIQAPKDAVIFTGTEAGERLEDLLIDFDEMSFFPGTLTPDPDEYAREWRKKLIYAIAKLQEEMAETFAEKLRFRLEKRERKIMREDYQQGAYVYMVESNDIENCIDETHKEIAYFTSKSAEEKAAQEAPIEAKWEDANAVAPFKCSACGGAVMYSKHVNTHEQCDFVSITLSKFCPHCGAKMANGEDDESEEVQNGGV